MLSLQNAEVIVRTGKLAKPKRSKLAAFLLFHSPFLCYKYRKCKFLSICLPNKILQSKLADNNELCSD